MSDTEQLGAQAAAPEDVPGGEPPSGTAEEPAPAAAPAEPGPAVASERPQAPAAARAEDAPAANGAGRVPPQETERAAPRRETDEGGSFSRYQEARQQISLSRLNRSAVAHGGPAFYAEQLTLGGETRVEVQTLGIPPLTIAQQLDCHLDVDQQTQMAARLAAQHVLLLAGKPGSGRLSTALTLLAGCCPDDRIHLLHSEAPGFLQEVCRRADELLTPDGFVLDLDDREVKLSTLETLGHLARTRRAFVVVLGDLARVDPDQLRPHAFVHRRPPLGDVLAVHLRRLLAGHPGACTDPECSTGHTTAFTARMLESPQVQRTLDGTVSVSSAVEFAEVLAQSVHREDTSLAEVIAQWRDRLRRLAKTLLRVPTETAQGPVLDPHRQAFRIAYAFFHGLPLADVFEAGQLLSASVLPRYETRELTPANHVFERELDQLIPPEMRAAAETVDPVSSRRAEDNPRCARLVDEELMHAVIEVVWHDYDSLRHPLLEWLTALVAGPLERIRVRAAQIAGILLSHDFDSVYRDLIRTWAGVKSAPYRQCAALALEMAAHDPRLVPRVRGQIRSWLSSPRWQFQDSAARAYGTLVGAQDVPDTLWALRELGTRPELALSSSVAFSMAWLHLTAAPGPVSDALDGWIASDNDHLTRHAIRTLLILSRYSAGPDRRDRPVLADAAMTDPDRADALVRLWRHALMGQYSSTRAWDQLRRWLLAGDADKELAAFLEALVPRICARPLSLRAGFYLGMWAGRHPDSGTVRGLRQRLAQGALATSTAS